MTPEQFHRAHAGFVRRLERASTRELSSRAADKLLTEFRAATPRRTGELESQWRRISGGGRNAQEEIQNAARHAGVILPGLRRSSTGRLIGSSQAPAGVFRPVKRFLDRRLGEAADSTIGRAFR